MNGAEDERKKGKETGSGGIKIVAERKAVRRMEARCDLRKVKRWVEDA